MTDTVSDTELAFKRTERPEVTVNREAKPNPFTDVVRDLRENGGENDAVEFTCPMGNESTRKGDKKVWTGVESQLRLLRLAGKANDCTVRSKVNLNIDGTKPKKGVATITFWAIDKVTRERKSQDDAK